MPVRTRSITRCTWKESYVARRHDRSWRPGFWLLAAARGRVGLSCGADAAGPRPAIASPRPSKPLEQLQRDFVDLRFGMFIHFGILTYTGSWSKPNLDIKLFNPTGLDPGQWADAAVAAKMKYGVLTTRHHDGFALWPSKRRRLQRGAHPLAQRQGRRRARIRRRVPQPRPAARPLLLDLGHHRGRRRRADDDREAGRTSRRSSPSCSPTTVRSPCWSWTDGRGRWATTRSRTRRSARW